VFVRTKRGADRLVKRLKARDVAAAAMHGDKSQSQRERALAGFQNGDCNVLVATDVAARGLDVDDITHVVNFDVPDDRETYVHRVGRTARAGRTGIGITFVSVDQARDVARMAGDLDLHGQFAAAGFGMSDHQSARRGGGGGGKPKPKRMHGSGDRVIASARNSGRRRSRRG
jgi:superfamily II DNA/RNA helicase